MTALAVILVRVLIFLIIARFVWSCILRVLKKTPLIKTRSSETVSRFRSPNATIEDAEFEDVHSKK